MRIGDTVPLSILETKAKVIQSLDKENVRYEWYRFTHCLCLESNLKNYLYLKLVESYILHAPDSPHFKVPQCKHVESTKAPKYIGAGIPATIKREKESISKVRRYILFGNILTLFVEQIKFNKIYIYCFKFYFQKLEVTFTVKFLDYKK